MFAVALVIPLARAGQQMNARYPEPIVAAQMADLDTLMIGLEKAVKENDLPTADDPKSFCAGPTAHMELADPTRPGELPLTYGVGSSSLTTPPGTPDDYWPRMVWVK